MPISNSQVSAKDVVILQRDDTNAFYGEVHVSGSLVIPYLDADGHLNFDTSQSFYNIFPPSGYTGPLNDSNHNKIADIVGGIIIKIYY